MRQHVMNVRNERVHDIKYELTCFFCSDIRQLIYPVLEDLPPPPVICPSTKTTRPLVWFEVCKYQDAAPY